MKFLCTFLLILLTFSNTALGKGRSFKVDQFNLGDPRTSSASPTDIIVDKHGNIIRSEATGWIFSEDGGSTFDSLAPKTPQEIKFINGAGIHTLFASTTGDVRTGLPSASGTPGEVLSLKDANGNTEWLPPAGVTVQHEGWRKFGGYGATDTKIPYGIFSASSTNPGGGLFTFSTSTVFGTTVTFLTANLEVTTCFSFGQSGEFGFTVNSSRLTTNISTIANSQDSDEIIAMTHASGAGGQNYSSVCFTFFPGSGQVLRPHTVGQTPNANFGRFNVTARQR